MERRPRDYAEIAHYCEPVTARTPFDLVIRSRFYISLHIVPDAVHRSWQHRPGTTDIRPPSPPTQPPSLRRLAVPAPARAARPNIPAARPRSLLPAPVAAQIRTNAICAAIRQTHPAAAPIALSHSPLQAPAAAAVPHRLHRATGTPPAQLKSHEHPSRSSVHVLLASAAAVPPPTHSVCTRTAHSVRRMYPAAAGAARI
ncbi:hypothetical protein C8R46DRAFT_1213499 [Mycena filopes]|nr:hypothetical protein C8R46DRAFT_1213499 [Mycena filopes]